MSEQDHVCTMCGRYATGPNMAAPGPMTFWPQLDAWICGDWDCRRHAEREASPEKFKPLGAKLRKVAPRA